MKALCLLPGLICVLAYSIYPMMLERLDLIAALERWLGEGALAAAIVEHADTLIVTTGIVLSAACWFASERRARGRR